MTRNWYDQNHTFCIQNLNGKQEMTSILAFAYRQILYYDHVNCITVVMFNEIKWRLN